MKPKNQLIKMSDHIEYEIWMLRLCVYLLVEKMGLTTSATTYPEVYALTHFTDEPVYSSGSPFSPPSSDEYEIALRNALIESYAVHLRSLLDFFFLDKPNRKKTDVIAADYFEDPNEWIENRPEMSQGQLQGIKDRVSKEVAHITINRIDKSPSDKIWPVIKYKEIVLEAKSAFDLCVDRSLLSDKWS